jgi:predicted nucleic acid-binding protein
MDILADTSKWISFLSNPEDKDSDRFYELILEDRICICPTIIQELLQGCRNKKEFKILKDKISGLKQLINDPYDAAIGASNLYLELR